MNPCGTCHNACACREATHAEIIRIVNEPGMTWKIRRALLRQLGLEETSVKELVPEPESEFHPGDY